MKSQDIPEAADSAVAAAAPCSLSTWWRRYRIVRDNHAGYEAQVWRIWWPFWVEIWHRGYICNTSPTTRLAEEVCRIHAEPRFVKNV